MKKKEGDSTIDSSGNKRHAIEVILSKKIALEAIIKKIEYYSTKNTVRDVDLYYLIKEFFRDFLELKYEFSIDELILELDKIYIETKQRDELTKFLEKIKLIEYRDNPFPESKIKEFIIEFLPLAKGLTKITGPPKDSIWTVIKQKFVKTPPVVFQDYESAAEQNIPKEIVKKELKGPVDSSLESITDNVKPEEQPLVVPRIPADTNYQKNTEQMDLAAIEAHNRQVLGKTDAETPSEIPADESSNKKQKGKNKKSETNSKIKSKKEDIKNKTEKTEEKKTVETKKVESSQTTPNAWTNDVPVETKENKINSKKTAKNDSKEQKKIKKNKAEKKIKTTSKKSSSKIEIKKAKTEKPSKKEQIQNKSTAKKEDSKPDISSLIEKSRKTKNKKELTELYKKINIIYEKGDASFQAKYYKALMTIYNKISSAK